MLITLQLTDQVKPGLPYYIMVLELSGYLMRVTNKYDVAR